MPLFSKFHGTAVWRKVCATAKYGLKCHLETPYIRTCEIFITMEFFLFENLQCCILYQNDPNCTTFWKIYGFHGLPILSVWPVKLALYGSAHQFYAAIELTRRLTKLDVVCIFFSCSFHIKSYIRKLVRS